MGGGVSKDELLYQEVQNGNVDGVKALRQGGASLEWVDKEGRTPLILACTRGELLNMALTLLNLGANIHTYRPGAYRGFPLHHAAKRGLDKTVILLLSRGANPLAINDDGNTPLELARSRGHVSVVRVLEEHLCLFSGALREISGFGLLETFAPNLVTKKIWAVVIPCENHPRRGLKFELAIYPSVKVAQPRTVILLSKAEIEEPKFNTVDPVLYIFDKSTKTKYKLLSEVEGDKVQLERLYKACQGVPQQVHSIGGPEVGPPAVSANQPVLQSVSVPSSIAPSPGVVAPSTQPNPPRINDYNGWDAQVESHNGWGSPDPKQQEKKTKSTSYGGWDDEKASYNGWGPAVTEPTTSQSPMQNSHHDATNAVAPSAPPLPIRYPSFSDTHDDAGPSSVSLDNSKADDKGGMCVVCWDAPAEGACIPCGHLAGCMNCLSEIQAKKWGCPVCREQINQVVKVYAV